MAAVSAVRSSLTSVVRFDSEATVRGHSWSRIWALDNARGRR